MKTRKSIAIDHTEALYKHIYIAHEAGILSEIYLKLTLFATHGCPVDSLLNYATQAQLILLYFDWFFRCCHL